MKCGVKMQDLEYIIKSIDNIGDYRIFKLIPEGEKLEYKAGHFVMLSNGEIGRPYSIASAPYMPYLEFAVHLVGGQFTSYLADVKVGEKINVKGPSGHFVYESNDNIILIGGGAGIAPLMSIIREAIGRKEKPKIDLFYSARYLHEAPYLSELIGYDKAGLINLHFTITREEVEGFRNGRFAPEDVENISDLSERVIYLCGNIKMANAFKEKLEGKVKKFNVEAWG